MKNNTIIRTVPTKKNYFQSGTRSVLPKKDQLFGLKSPQKLENDTNGGASCTSLQY